MELLELRRSVVELVGQVEAALELMEAGPNGRVLATPG